jgi:hypothetical protein
MDNTRMIGSARILVKPNHFLGSSTAIKVCTVPTYLFNQTCDIVRYLNALNNYDVFNSLYLLPQHDLNLRYQS